MDIPDCLMEEIFLRLPAKSLLRFRSLSKPWNSIIISDQFVRRHRETQLRNDTSCSSCTDQLFFLNNVIPFSSWTVIGLHHDRDSRYSEIFSGKFPRRNFFFEEVLQQSSCHGLVCYLARHKRQDYGCDYSVVMCKPFVRVYPSPFKAGYSNLALGYDPSSQEYKVLIIDGYICGDRKIHILNLRTNEWMSVECPTLKDYNLDTGIPSVAVDGYVYWLAGKRYEFSGYVIMRFDLAKYQLNVITFPAKNDHDEEVRCRQQVISQYNGSLCFYGYGGCKLGSDDFGNCVDIWILKEETSTWTKHKSVILEISGRGPCYDVVGLICHGHHLLLREKEGPSLIVVDLEQKTLEQVEPRTSIATLNKLQLLEAETLSSFLKLLPLNGVTEVERLSPTCQMYSEVTKLDNQYP